MEFRVLGVLEALESGRALPLGGPKQRLVLAMLLVQANRGVSADSLCDGLWGDQPPSRAVATLRVYVSNLRKVLEPDRNARAEPSVLLTQPDGYRLVIEPEQVDARRFERLVGEAQSATRSGDANGTLLLLDEALGLWRGPAWAEFAFEEFARSEAARLDDLYLMALEDRVDARLALGEHAALVGELEGLVGEHPFRERLWAQLMLALYRDDRQAEALRAFGRLRHALGEELGIEPSTSLRNLEHAIVLQEADLDWTPPAVTAASVAATDAAASSAPSGTVTFLFTDVEGSTRLWEDQPDAMKATLARHDAILEDAITGHGGHLVKSTGDGVHAAFATTADAIAAAVDAQLVLVDEQWPEATPLRVRMGLHTGEADYRDGDYYGPALNRAARLAGAAHGSQILVSQATAGVVGERLPAGVVLDDLGEHRLRDLTRPARVYQVLHPLLPGDFAPVRSLDAYPGNLPLQLTSFVGRVEELAEVARALRDSRLVTLIGVGGVGKTRLAVQVAAALLPQFPGGAWLCELATASDDALMFHTVADAIGARQREGLSMAESVVEFLRNREMLLVFDNCEHLLVDSARLASEVLQRCPRVQILATSREGLGVAGEQVVPLGSLSVPGATDDPSVASASDAIRLFRDRASAARSSFAVSDANLDAVAEICRRLDGMPLAIELAAARVTAMSPAEISAHLDERFRLLTGGRRSRVERHQTLRATVEWSYALLDDTERQVFDRLGVFVGTFDAEAAQAVVADDVLEDWDVLDGLTGLVEKSMIVTDEADDGTTRYWLLETLRAFAREKLDATGDTDGWRRRHARYYAEFCERVRPQLVGSHEDVWVGRVDTEVDNIWAALRWGLDSSAQEDADLALRVIIALTGAPGSAIGRAARWGLQEWAESVLAAARSSVLPGRAHAISLAAMWRINLLYDLETAEELGWEALRSPSAADAPQSIAQGYYTLATVRYRQGRTHEAQEFVVAGHRALEAAGAPRACHGVLYGMSSLLHVTSGDFDAARREADACLEVARSAESAMMLQAALAFAGRAWFSEDPDRALALFEESIAFCQIEMSNSMALGGAAQLRARSGDRVTALAHLRGAIAVDHDMGARASIGFTVERAVVILARLGDDELAATCAGIVQGEVVTTFRTLPQADRAAARAAERLGPDAYEAARARGAALTYEDVAPTLLSALDELLRSD